MPDRFTLPTATAPRTTWGVHEISTARYGESRARLLILPPDITRRERLLWRLLHVWPVGGFLLGTAVAVGLTPVTDLALAATAGLLTWFIPVGVIWLAASDLLSRIRERWATAPVAGDDGRVSALDQIGARLDAAAAAWRAGRTDGAEFRRMWQESYDSLGETDTVPAAPPRVER